MSSKSGNPGFRHLANGRRARRAALLFALAATCPAALIVPSSPSLAGHDDDHGERMRETSRAQQRQAEEAAKHMQKEAREQQRRAEDSQREAAQRAQQQQREHARQSETRSSSPVTPQRQIESDRTQNPDNYSQSNNSPDRIKNSGSSESSTRNNGAVSNASGTRDRTDRQDDKSKAEKSHSADISDAPPATVERWFKQVFDPKPQEVETKPVIVPNVAAGPPPSNRPAAGKAVPLAAANPKTPLAAKAAAPARRPPEIELPSLPLPEVLAVNATPQTLQRALALGFSAKPATNLANLDFAVTRLLPPAGMSSTDAQALLKRELPQGSFAPNQKYRIYKTASESKTLPAGTHATTLEPGNLGCDHDRCFGTDIIGWKPQLNSCVSGVKVGIIDTSIDTKHPAFADKKLELKHFGSAGAPGPDWHGTGITALLAGGAASGTPGLIPDANFYVADIFHADADSEPASDTVSMLRAFDWLEAKGVKIINMSLAGPPDDLIRQAVEKLSAKGILMVAAAGNEGPAAGPSYPAAYEQVIAVTAVNKELQNYRYANRGSYIDVSAPGVAIWTALPGAQGGYHSGTSFATPYVTAALAAIYPHLASKTQAEALQQISYKDLGTPGLDPIYGHGLLVAPVTCGTGLMAKVASPAGISAQTRTTSAPFAIPPSGVTEQLPWLGLTRTSN